MKKLIMLSLLISSVASAEIWDSPNGKMECKPMDAPKVIKKKRAVKPKEPPKPLVVEKIVEKVVEKTQVVEVPTYKKNRVSLLFGLAPNGYDFERSDRVVYVSDSSGPALGLSYERQLSEKWGLQVIGITNYSILLGPTYSW